MGTQDAAARTPADCATPGDALGSGSVPGHDPYRSAAYVESLAHVGVPEALPASQAWFLRRPFGDGYDAAGPYPLLVCGDWGALGEDLRALEQPGGPVSFTAVCDPMGAWETARLDEVFRDRWEPYKEHFLVDLDRPLAECLSSHHKRKVKRGRQEVVVEFAPWTEGQACSQESRNEWIKDWQRLYGHLVQRHGIAGPAAFPAASLAAQLSLPGAVVQRARIEATTVSLVVWYPAGEGMRYHLAGTSPEGYAASATYALFASALERFREQGLAWAHLGAGAGVRADQGDGLTRFKAGWATRTRTAYLGGRILDPTRYRAWSAQRGAAQAGNQPGAFFPCYRAPQPAAPSSDGEPERG